MGEREPGPEAGWEALPYDSVSLTRGPCLGNCPEYTVVLGTPGRAEFRGVAHAPRAGVWHGRVPLPAYQQVAGTIQSARLDVASRAYPTQMTDQVDIDLRIWRRGEATPVTLSDRGGDAPRELGLVHAAVDSIARTIEWREGPWRP